MPLIRTLALAVSCCLMTACTAGVDQGPTSSTKAASDEPIRIVLDPATPAKSLGSIAVNGTTNQFAVGYGKYGIACEGTTFQEGWTPLGRFRVNAILTADRFEMDLDLIKSSGKSEAELAQELFRDMNSIDFSGDGVSGEYGDGYISLEPIPESDQPFVFNTYAGTFRWYSFAIHGTNDEKRIGQKVTGGCINVNNMSLSMILSAVKMGDEVVITSTGGCVS